MAAKRKPLTPIATSPARQKARHDLADVFNKALTFTHTDHHIAAKSLGVARRTVGAWARGERPIVVELVLAAPRLARAFKRELCGDHRDEPAPYIARKKASR